MWKRLVLVAASIAGVSYLRKKAKDQQAEQDLWAQATDTVPSATPQPNPSA
jgi:hypothetical protein